MEIRSSRPDNPAGEKQRLLDELKSGHDTFLAALNGVSEDDARIRPEDGRWSVLECVEHVAIAQAHMLHQVEIAEAADTSAAGAGAIDARREHIIATRLLDRTRKVDAPDIAKPDGRFPSLAAAIQDFQSTHLHARTFIERNNEDLRSLLARHPLIGAVNCYEMLVIVAAHPARHARQIEEIRNQLPVTAPRGASAESDPRSSADPTTRPD